MNLFEVYPLFPVELRSAYGVELIDKENKKYLDLYGGHAVISIGHSHPLFVKALQDQVRDLVFYSNSVQMPLQKVLANKLGHLSGYQEYQLFLCNSGAEANENAMKLASFHTGRKKVIYFSGSFHGRTSAAVAATDDEKLQAPLNSSSNFIRCEWNNEDMLQRLMMEEDCAAVIIEGIQGVGGIQLPANGFLEKIQTLCEQTGALFICDEIQSGYGRTGKFFAHQHSKAKPDIITVAKGMGNGFPIAGVLIRPGIQPKLGLLGTTFGGAYLACVAGISVLTVLEEENLMQNAAMLEQLLYKELQGTEGIKEVRGRGLMIGIELEMGVQAVRHALLFEHEIFTGSSGNHTLRILPPLCITARQLLKFTNSLKAVLQNQRVHENIQAL